MDCIYVSGNMSEPLKYVSGCLLIAVGCYLCPDYAQ